MRFPSVPPVALGVALLTACVVPSDQQGNSPLFSRRITFDEFNQTLTTGSARLEIELQPLVAGSPAIAREVEIQEAEDLGDEESIEAAVVRFEGLETSATACRGTIVLAPSFMVQFDRATTDFEGEEDDDLTCAQFVERVQAALGAGGSPVVEAERPTPAEPQAPDAAAFAATELKLEDSDDDEAPEVEINVDADNLLACSSVASPPPAGCVGVLQVLNVSIALVQETELESEMENEEQEDVDFEGAVTAVAREGTSCTVGSVTLEDGTVVRLVGETELKNESGDDKQLDDLCAVEAALAAGAVVEADGKGLVTGGTPPTILASEVEFETEDDD